MPLYASNKGFVQELIMLVLLAALVAGASYWYYIVHIKANSLDYVDPRFHYSLTFPASWNGYVIETQGDETIFGVDLSYDVPPFQPLFYMGATDKTSWSQNVGGTGGPNDRYMTTSGNLVYHYGIYNNSDPALSTEVPAVPSIIQSFKLQ